MEVDQFWTLVETARAAAEPTIAAKDDGEDAGEPIAKELTGLLTALGADSVVSFATHFDLATSTLHRWDVWAAAYLINGGCSDDSFIDFKAGIVTLGRDWHQRVLVNPDSLADHPLVLGAAAGDNQYALFAEDVNYVPSYAFERITGDDHGHPDVAEAASTSAESGEPDMGEYFDFDDLHELRRRLPRLAAMFLP